MPVEGVQERGLLVRQLPVDAGVVLLAQPGTGPKKSSHLGILRRQMTAAAMLANAAKCSPLRS
ncbi:hypothetical protein, partial [Kitasatospora aureofaciens]|uniref:hypothetical protein n=1 Tax=Kitasatospora aureofaciens TaxID=1894 RepID=UPI0033D2A770